MASGHKFPAPTSQGRIVDHKIHLDGRRIDVNNLKCRPILIIGNCLSDRHLYKSRQPDDIAGSGMLNFRAFQTFVSKQRSDIGAFATPIEVNQNDGIAHRDTATHDAPEDQSPDIIAIINIPDKKLKLSLLRIYRKSKMLNVNVQLSK